MAWNERPLGGPGVDAARMTLQERANNPYGLQSAGQTNAALKPYYRALGVPEHVRLRENTVQNRGEWLMAGRDPTKWTTDEQGRPRRLTDQERISLYQDAQIKNDMGALDDSGNLFDRRGAYDDIFHTLPQDNIPASLRATYRQKANEYRRNLGLALAQHNKAFQSVEEYEDFLKQVPGGNNPMLRAAVRETGEAMLRRSNPALYEKFQQKKQLDEVNDRAKVAWFKQTHPETLPGTSDEDILWLANLANEEYLNDPRAQKYVLDPTTGKPVALPPPEMTPQQQWQQGMETIQFQVDELNKRQPGTWEVGFDEAGNPVPTRVEQAEPSLLDRRQVKQQEIDAYNTARPEGSPEMEVVYDAGSGEFTVQEKQAAEQKGLGKVGTDIFRSKSKKEQGEIVEEIYSKMYSKADMSGVEPEKADETRSAIDEQHRQAQELMAKYGLGIEDIFQITGRAFTSPEEAEAANLPKGTIIMIGGRRAIVE